MYMSDEMYIHVALFGMRKSFRARAGIACI